MDEQQRPVITRAGDSTPLSTANTNHRSFSIGDTLREGWELTSGFKGTLWLALLIYVVLSVVLELVVGSLLGMNTQNGFGAVLTGAILFPLTIGIGILGIRRAAGEETDAMDIFSSYAFILPLIIGYIAYVVMVMLGLLLLIIPGIYLSVMLVWFGQIIVLKQLSPVDALKESWRRMKGNFWAYFAIGLVLGLGIIISAIPLGLGLIWTLPWAVATTGVLFNRLFDDQSAAF